jgi:hypothetical protein
MLRELHSILNFLRTHCWPILYGVHIYGTPYDSKFTLIYSFSKETIVKRTKIRIGCLFYFSFRLETLARDDCDFIVRSTVAALYTNVTSIERYPYVTWRFSRHIFYHWGSTSEQLLDDGIGKLVSFPCRTSTGLFCWTRWRGDSCVQLSKCSWSARPHASKLENGIRWMIHSHGLAKTADTINYSYQLVGSWRDQNRIWWVGYLERVSRRFLLGMASGYHYLSVQVREIRYAKKTFAKKTNPASRASE